MEGDASICAPSKGIGTKEEENGVAPEEKGTFGLFVLLTTVVLSPNEVINEPAKNKLSAEELVVVPVSQRYFQKHLECLTGHRVMRWYY